MGDHEEEQGNNHVEGDEEEQLSAPNGSTEASPQNSRKKRTYSEDGLAGAGAGQQGEDNKKSRGANYNQARTPAGTPMAMGANTMIMEILPEKVGSIIGSKGQVIQEVQFRTGAKAFVNQDFPPTVNRQLHLTGTPEQIQAASDLIRRIITEGPTAIHVNSLNGGPPAQRVLECSQGQVGKVIGSAGATINDMQSKSGAKIQIDQDFPPDVPRKIRIEGSTTAVNVAARLIMDLLAQPDRGPTNRGGGGGGGAYGGMQGGQAYGQQPQQYGQYGGYPPMGTSGMGGMGMGGGMPGAMGVTTTDMTHVVEVPKSTVGKIIGKGGETISMIQSKSGCIVKVDQNVPEGAPCRVSIHGTAHNIGIACQIVGEITSGLHTSKIGINLPAPILNGVPVQQPQAQAQQPYMYGMPSAMPYPMYGYPQGYAPPMSAPMNPMAAMGPMAGQPPVQAAHPQAQPYGYPYMPPQQGGYMQPAAGYPPVGHAPAPVAPAPAPKPAPAPSLWTEHKTDDGLPYWYNASTGVSQWERPKNA